MEELVHKGIDSYYRITHCFTIVITISILLYIWIKYLNIRDVLSIDEERDYALVLLSLALFVWGVLAFCKYLDIELSNNVSVTFSTINNCLFLSSFPFFEHGFKFLQKRRSRYYWFLGIIITGILSTMAALILFSKYPTEDQAWIGYTVDLFLTTITLLALGRLLFNSFKERNLVGIGYISILFILMMIIATIALTWGIDAKLSIWDEVLFLTSSFGLSSVFIALTFSWINELNNRVFSNIYVLSNDNTQKSIELGNITKKDLRAKLENNLADDKSEETIEELLTYFRKEKIYKGLKDVIPIAASLTRLMTDRLRNVIDNHEYNTSRNKINNSLLDIVDKYL